jgi:glycosyltransferase involved in cell wall biosynthesis
MESNKTISIVIRVRNAENDLRRCFTGLRGQQLPAGHNLEIIVVDNESTDNSTEVARQFEADVVFLAAQDFSWGRALNRGIAKAAGDIILILSADAYPVDNNWIMEMLVPFENPKVAAVYGRQVPRPDAPIDEVVRLGKTFGETTQIAESIPEGFSPRGGNFPVSNACAAIRKSIWEKIPYDELISGGEEGIWTYDVFQKGYFVVYQAKACVYHSHNDSLFRNAWRNLELIKKNVELVGRENILFVYIQFLLLKIKRRTYNCFFPGLRLSSRLKGIAILPLEVLSFCVAVLFFHNPKKASKYRSFFWSK